MNSWLLRFCLFAENERFRALSQGFRGERAELSLSELLLGVACLGGIVLAIWIVGRLLQRPVRKVEQRHPGRLFGALCRAHGIGFRGRCVLRELAKEAGLAQPAMLFVSPEVFDAHLDAAPSRRQARYAALRKQLFGPRHDVLPVAAPHA